MYTNTHFNLSKGKFLVSVWYEILITLFLTIYNLVYKKK